MGFLDGRRNVKVEMDDGSHKVAAMVEGAGVFVCHIHQFATEDIEKWNIHIKTEQHAFTGGSTGKCVICGANLASLANTATNTYYFTSVMGSLAKLVPIIEPIVEFKEIYTNTRKSLDEV